MGVFYDNIHETHKTWINKQKVVFISTAPLDPNGKVNLSPKGYSCFRVIGPNQVCYLDLTGSGIETLSHIQENGRITIMFCAFEGGPKILRLFGIGSIHRVGSPTYKALFATHYSPENCDIYDANGIRSIIFVDVYKVGISCGWGVPFYEYKGPRQTLYRFSGKKTNEQIAAYWAEGNTHSLDGLPGMRHEMMGPEWAELSAEDHKKLSRFRGMKGAGAGVGWWDWKYVADNASLVAVGTGVGAIVGAAAAALFMKRRS
ncbi:hypothetical protein EC991_004275 [Linnemannia zychae]|nr:hypothetical protein EC991_004275 [Linnemannia zychae]